MRRITTISVLSHNTMLVTNTGIAAPEPLSEMIYSRQGIYTSLGLGDTFAQHSMHCIQCKHIWHPIQIHNSKIRNLNVDNKKKNERKVQGLKFESKIGM